MKRKGTLPKFNLNLINLCLKKLRRAPLKNGILISWKTRVFHLFQPRDPLINRETEQGPPDLKK